MNDNVLTLHTLDGPVVSRPWKAYLSVGIALTLLGGTAATLPSLERFAGGVSFGAIFLAAGASLGLVSLGTRRSASSGSIAFSAVGYSAVGLALMTLPVSSHLSLSLLLGLVFALVGSSKIELSWRMRHSPRWSWLLVRGIASLGLATAVLVTLPLQEPWSIGVFVGVHMALAGASYALHALSARRADSVWAMRRELALAS